MNELLEMQAKFFPWGGGGLRERDHSEDPDVDGRIILTWIFRNWDGEAWTGWIWLRVGTCGGLLYIR